MMTRNFLTLALAAFVAVAVPSLRAQEATPNATNSFEIPDSDDGLPGVGPVRRYDWFRDLWRKKRSQWAQRVAEDGQAVVFLGDSITQGWGDDFRGSFGEMKVANRGISGDTTRGMLMRLQEDVLSLNPRAVVLLMGTNDLEEGATPEQVAENFRQILAALKEHDADMPIVVSLVFPSSSEKSRPADKIKQINELYMQSVKGDPQVTVLDTWTLFANAAGDAKVEEFPDLLHPNELGYAKWAGAVRPVLATLGLLETESESFVPEPGFESLFNGRNLQGWCWLPTSSEMLKQRSNWQSKNPDAPPWPIVQKRKELGDKTVTEDGRYLAKAGRLIVTTPPEGRKIQQLWTCREFPHDFDLKLEFRATPNADSGIFLRGKQLQCRDFPLAGPYKDLSQFRQGDWNLMEIEVRGQQARCRCNGEILEEALEIPKSGHIGLEGDRGQMEFRQIRIREYR